jgi:hypothetical protein
MIEAGGLTKRYGDKLAVDNLTFTVRSAWSPGSSGRTARARPLLDCDIHGGPGTPPAHHPGTQHRTDAIGHATGIGPTAAGQESISRALGGAPRAAVVSALLPGRRTCAHERR